MNRVPRSAVQGRTHSLAIRYVAGVDLILLSLAALALAQDAKPQPGPVTGTWECQSHGGPEGDTPFTLTLEQDKETVTGSVASPLGSTDISSGSFKNDVLEIHIESPQANYVLSGKVKDGQIAGGEWHTDTDLKGTWEGKKSAGTSKEDKTAESEQSL